MNAKKKLVKFTLDEVTEARAETTIAGRSVAILTRVRVVSPAVVTKADVEALAATAKKIDADDPQSYVAVDLGPLGTCEFHPDFGDVEEVASYLCGNGVSVSDWSPYRLD